MTCGFVASPPADCEGVLDLAIVLDSSGSITDTGAENWNITKNFVADLTRRFNVGQDSNQVRVSGKQGSNDTYMYHNMPISHFVLVSVLGMDKRKKRKRVFCCCLLGRCDIL